MKIVFIFVLLFSMSVAQAKPRIAITIDDPNYRETPLFGWDTRNGKMLEALSYYNLKAALFVCGMRVNSDTGKALISAWNDEGHIIANHSFSHLYYPSKKVTPEIYRDDFLQCDSLISGYSNFKKLFRFPYLKEGDTEIKRDGFRDVLNAAGYKIGYVSVDASDWYIDGRMIDRLKENPSADLTPYRDFYLKHIMARAQYYNTLAKDVFGREIDHVLLIHHSLLNALFLKDLIQHLKDSGWDVINADEAYKDSVYSLYPDIIPAGESIVWAAAKETGRYESSLRYPGEDGEYEKEEMDRLGL